VTGAVLRTFNACADAATANCAPKEAGLNRVQWNLGRDGGGGGGRAGGGRGGFGQALDPGTYLVKLTVAGKELTTKVVIEADELR
jgi:hypothetical protein